MINQVEMDDITSRSAEYQQIRGTQAWAEFSEQVKTRDGCQCQICGCTEHLEPHHKTYWKDGQRAWLNPDVAVTLCRKCHQIVTECVWEAREINTVIIPEATYNTRYMSAEQIFDRINWQINATRCKDIGDLISKHIVRLWERSLEPDAGPDSIKTDDKINRIGLILWESILGQANGIVPPDMGEPMFNKKATEAITALEIQKYFNWFSQGEPDIEIQERLKMTPNRWYKFMNRIYGGGTK